MLLRAGAERRLRPAADRCAARASAIQLSRRLRLLRERRRRPAQIAVPRRRRAAAFARRCRPSCGWPCRTRPARPGLRAASRPIAAGSGSLSMRDRRDRAPARSCGPSPRPPRSARRRSATMRSSPSSEIAAPDAGHRARRRKIEFADARMRVRRAQDRRLRAGRHDGCRRYISPRPSPCRAPRRAASRASSPSKRPAQASATARKMSVIGAAAAEMSRQRGADLLARRRRRALAPRASGRETPPPRR